METIDAGGEWWLPARPERRVAGWLTFDGDNGVRLRLVGSFRDIHEDGERRPGGSIVMTDEALDHAGTYARVHGQIGGNAVTLDRCFRMRLDRTFFRGDLASEEIHADRMYQGVWYDPAEEASGDQMTVALSHLVYWMQPSTLADVDDKGDIGATGVSGPHRLRVTDGGDPDDAGRVDHDAVAPAGVGDGTGPRVALAGHGPAATPEPLQQSVHRSSAAFVPSLARGATGLLVQRSMPPGPPKERCHSTQNEADHRRHGSGDRRGE